MTVGNLYTMNLPNRQLCLTLVLSETCKQHCRYCYRKLVPGWGSVTGMQYKESLLVVEDVADLYPQHKIRLFITGGDPLQWETQGKNVADILVYASKSQLFDTLTLATCARDYARLEQVLDGFIAKSQAKLELLVTVDRWHSGSVNPVGGKSPVLDKLLALWKLNSAVRSNVTIMVRSSRSAIEDESIERSLQRRYGVYFKWLPSAAMVPYGQWKMNDSRWCTVPHLVPSRTDKKTLGTFFERIYQFALSRKLCLSKKDFNNLENLSLLKALDSPACGKMIYAWRDSYYVCDHHLGKPVFRLGVIGQRPWRGRGILEEQFTDLGWLQRLGGMCLIEHSSPEEHSNMMDMRYPIACPGCYACIYYYRKNPNYTLFLSKAVRDNNW